MSEQREAAALPQRLVGSRPKGEQLRQLLEELIAELGAGANSRGPSVPPPRGR